MVGQFNNLIKKIIKFIVFLLILIVVLDLFYFNLVGYHLIDILNSNFSLVFDGDYFYQHQHFYQEFYRLLKQKEVAYSLNYFLGTNFYASKGYYVLGDIYAWIGYFDYLKKVDILVIMTRLNILRFLISGISMYLFLSSLKYHFFNKTIFGICYMLGGSVSMFIENPMFLTFYSFLPLLYFGLERLIQYNDFICLILAISLLSISNYYLLFSALIFGLVYFIVRYLVVHLFNFKKFIITCLYGLIGTIIAFLISAIIVYPSVLMMLNSPRLASNLVYSSFENNQIGRIITNFMTPMTFQNNSLYFDYWYYFYQIGIYAGLISLWASFYVFINKKSFYYLIIVFFCGLSLSHPIFGKIFNFSYSFRYTVNISLMLMFLASTGLENIIKHLKMKKFILIAGISLSSIFLMYHFVLDFWFKKVYATNFEFLEANNLNQVLILVLIYFALTLIIVLIRKYRYFLWLTMTLFLMVVGYEMINFNYAHFKTMQIPEKTSHLDYDFKKIINYLQTIDTDYYRIITNKDLINEHLSYNYPIPITYDSVYQYSLFDLLTTLRLYPEATWRFSLQKLDYATAFPMFNIRYLISDDLSQQEHYLWYADLIYSLGKWQVYKFKKPTGMLKSYHRFDNYDLASYELNKDSFKKPVHEVMSYLNNYLLFYPKDYLKLNLVNQDKVDEFFQTKIYRDNYLEFDVDLKEDTILMLSLAYDANWSVLIDNQETEIFKVNGGLIGFKAKANTKKIIFKFNQENTIAKLLSFSGFSLLLIILLFKTIRSLYVKNRCYYRQK